MAPLDPDFTRGRAPDPKLTHAIDQAIAGARGISEAAAAFYSTAWRKLLTDEGLDDHHARKVARHMVAQYIVAALLPPPSGAPGGSHG